MSKAWGAWRFYGSGYLCSDEAEIDDTIMSQMLSIMGYTDIEEFGSTVGSYDRYELPGDIQAKIQKIFSKPSYSSKDVPDELRISNGIIAKLDETLVIKSPFRLADNHSPLEFEIYSMSIEEEDGSFSVDLRAGISSDRLFEPISEALENLCIILIDKLAAGKIEDIDDQDRELLENYLNDQGAPAGLAADDEFLQELGVQVQFMVETIGVCSIPFTDASGEEVEFWIEADEEIGFSQPEA